MRKSILDVDALIDEVKTKLAKTASAGDLEYVMPESALWAEEPSVYDLPLDTSEEIRRIASEWDPILHDAHPEGSHKLEGVDEKDDLAVVEDLPERHEKIMKAVETDPKGEKKAAWLSRVEKFAATLRHAGHADLGSKLAARLKPFKNATANINIANANEVLNKFQKAVETAYSEMNVSGVEAAAYSVNHDKILEKLAEARGAIAAQDAQKFEGVLQEVRPLLNEALKQLTSKVGEEKATEYFQLWQALITQLDRAVASKDPEQTSAQPSATPTQSEPSVEMQADKATMAPAAPAEQAKPTQQHIPWKGDASAMMTNIQKLYNEKVKAFNQTARGTHLPLLNVNGKPGDQFTFAQIEHVFGLKAGRDFRNWNEMVAKLQAATVTPEATQEANELE